MPQIAVNAAKLSIKKIMQNLHKAALTATLKGNENRGRKFYKIVL